MLGPTACEGQPCEHSRLDYTYVSQVGRDVLYIHVILLLFSRCVQ